LVNAAGSTELAELDVKTPLYHITRRSAKITNPIYIF